MVDHIMAKIPRSKTSDWMKDTTNALQRVVAQNFHPDQRLRITSEIVSIDGVETVVRFTIAPNHDPPLVFEGD